MAREVMGLLSALTAGGSLLDDGAVAGGDDSVIAVEAKPTLPQGGTVGGFSLIQVLGRGGMGTVFEAVQLNPRRSVALKVLQAWTATPAARRQFLEEANILARLQHPGIARVFSAGTHTLEVSGSDTPLFNGLFNDARSVPWIAMELVTGARPLTDFADSSGLNLRQRLELFVGICDAVHHGHCQGIIHRDLKPANILVNDAGEPKVIDFGVARAVGGEAAEMVATMHTGVQAIVGTLRYMSPEQCQGRGDAVDTRSDVYSLGVVLYELLTGRLPYDLDDDSFAASARTVCESEPIPPRRLVPALPPDVQTILLKTLEKEPARRYASASDLAADIRRFLATQPIAARPATLFYVTTRFARRRPAVVALMLLTTLAVLVGLVGVSVGLSRARAANALAEQKRDEAERQAILANLGAADSAIRLGDGGTGRLRLAAIPEGRRNWEWRYLNAQADTSVRQVSVPEQPHWSGVSPDGQQLLSWMEVSEKVGRLEMRDATSLKILWHVEDLPASGACTFSKDGRLIAVTGEARIVILRADNGKLSRELSLPPGSTALGGAFSPDGTIFALGCAPSFGVFAFDLVSGEIVFRISSTAWVYDVDFSPDGLLLGWSDDASAVFVDTAKWTVRRRVPTLRPRRTEISYAKFSPDGTRMAVSCGPVAELLDPTGRVDPIVLRGHMQLVTGFAFSNDGRQLLTASFDKTVRLWDLEKLSVQRIYLGHDAPLNAVGFNVCDQAGNIQSFATTDRKGTVRWWQTGKSSELPDSFPGPSETMRFPDSFASVTQLLFSKDGTEVWATDVEHIGILNTDDPTPATLIHTGRLWQSISPDCTRAIGVVEKNRLDLYSLPDCSLQWQMDMGQGIFRSRFSRDGTLICTTLLDGTIVFMRTQDGSEISRTRTFETSVTVQDFTPNATAIFTSYKNGEIHCWDCSTGRHLAMVMPPNDTDPPCVRVSDDGTLIAAIGGKKEIIILSGKADRELLRFPAPSATTWSMAINPDNTRLAVGDQDRITHIYDMATGDELLQLRGHTGSVMSLAWSHDGRFLASGGYDHRVLLYDSAPQKR